MNRLLCLALLALLAGCPEAASDPDGGFDVGADAGSDVGLDTGSADVEAPGADAGRDAGSDTRDDDAGDAGPVVRSLVINEVQASGDDWIEVANVSGVPLAVAGFVVTQTDDAGEPEPDRGALFPSGAMLPAGAHFFILLQQTITPGFQTECIVEGVEQCLFADFGISNADGDTLVVLDAEGVEVDRVIYTSDAAPSESTYGRIPDGTGEFVVTTPTPVAPNEE